MLPQRARFIVFAVVLSCVPPTFCQWNGQPPLPSSCGADSVKFKTSAGPVGDTAPSLPADKATVYVILQTGSIGISPTARIGLDGNWVGAVRGSSFIRFAVDPGPRHLCSSFEPSLTTPDNRTALSNLNFEPGKVYFFLIRITDSRNGSVQDFLMLSEDEGKYLVSQGRLSLSAPR